MALGLAESGSTPTHITFGSEVYLSPSNWSQREPMAFDRACQSILPATSTATTPKWYDSVLGPIVGALCAVAGGAIATKLASTREKNLQAHLDMTKARARIRAAFEAHIADSNLDITSTWPEVISACGDMEVAIQGFPIADNHGAKNSARAALDIVKCSAAPNVLAVDIVQLHAKRKECWNDFLSLVEAVSLIEAGLVARLLKRRSPA